MEEIYKINGKYQLKSISNSSKIISTLPAYFLFLYMAEGSKAILQTSAYIIWLGFFLFFLLPAIYFHITYYVANKDIAVAVNKERQTITIKHKNLEKVLQASDIRKVIRVINPDFRHEKWQQNWQPMPWRSYGYVKIITKSNEVFLLTSLMLDPLQPPINVTEMQYKLLPELDTMLEDEPTEDEIASYKSDLINTYRLKFANYSEQELLEKILGKGYKREAATAAEELLKEKYGRTVTV